MHTISSLLIFSHSSSPMQLSFSSHIHTSAVPTTCSPLPSLSPSIPPFLHIHIIVCQRANERVVSVGMGDAIALTTRHRNTLLRSCLYSLLSSPLKREREKNTIAFSGYSLHHLIWGGDQAKDIGRPRVTSASQDSLNVECRRIM